MGKAKKDFNAVVGRNIMLLRRQKGLSQAELGKVIDLHQTAISRVESGDQSINCWQIKALIDLFSVKIQRFFEEE